jgi:hypothetical protein
MGEFGGLKFQCFGYKVFPTHLWKISKVKVKIMFGHREFGGHFKKYSLTKLDRNVLL